MSIPVICDRCGSTGIAGEADFSNLGELLGRRRARRQGGKPAMTSTATIGMLKRGHTAAEEWRRHAARVAWIKATVAALREAHRRADEAWDRIFAALPDDIDDDELEAMNLPDPPERAEVDALHAVVKHDRWPRHLHFGGL